MATANQTQPKKESAIPVGTQFSPALIRLSAFVSALVANSGNKTALETAVWATNVRITPAKVPTKRRKSLPIEAAVQYGLLDSSYKVTPLAQTLASLKEPEIYASFARHILLNCGGLRVLEGIEQMEADAERITGDTLAQYLSDQGFNVTVHNTAINSLRMWLAEAGLFPKHGAKSWDFDRLRREELVPLTGTQISILAGAGAGVHAFVRALCREAPDGWVLASNIRDAAEAIDGVRIGRSSLPNEILKPLEEAGLIEYATEGTGSGKSSKLRTTVKFDKEILQPFVTTTVTHLDAVISDYYKRRSEDIYVDLDSSDTFIRGRALEAFAIMVMRKLGLRFVGWNKRAADSTAQAEVDVVLSGVLSAVPTRWQVQCKNTPSYNIGVRDVASEVGLLPISQATHILIIANTDFSGDAIFYANEVMRRTPISIYLLDKSDFRVIKKDPSKLVTILRLKAERIDKLQRTAILFGGR